MSREILFKAKRLSDGKWVEGNLFIDDKGSEAEILIGYTNYRIAYKIDKETLCQYTGLTDKNGNKIWENDVCSVDLIGTGKIETENCIVRYGRRAENFKIELGFSVEWTETNYLRGDIGWWVENRELEVIGNIFDNQELLKGEPS